MPPIILTTINARYYHTALGLRWLAANLGELSTQAVIREFQSGPSAAQIAESLLAEDPRIIGLGAYIWNVPLLTDVVRIIRSVRPGVTLVVGGPEASHEYEGTELFALADYLVRGEGERPFAALARALLRGERPPSKVIDDGPTDLAGLALPYDLYTDEDIARRRIFVEASRGCPFRCDFCLSSLDPCVREFPLAPFLEAMERLIRRGAREFIFVDRTFNLKSDRVISILDFFLERWCDGIHLHFEIAPDRLDADLMHSLARFPAGGLHLEAGVQTFNPDVQSAISRRQDIEKTIENMTFLGRQTAAWIHADLIIGLPGESMQSFAAGFDRLLALRPQQIQVGVLKRLKGAPIARHTLAHQMVYSAQPPYDILQNDQLDFFAMQRLKRFARYFDLYYNSGNFPESLELVWRARLSAFESFMALSDFIWDCTGRTHELSLINLARQLYEFLIDHPGGEREVIAATLNRDYHRLPGRREKLDFISL